MDTRTVVMHGARLSMRRSVPWMERLSLVRWGLSLVGGERETEEPPSGPGVVGSGEGAAHWVGIGIVHPEQIPGP